MRDQENAKQRSSSAVRVPTVAGALIDMTSHADNTRLGDRALGCQHTFLANLGSEGRRLAQYFLPLSLTLSLTLTLSL